MTLWSRYSEETVEVAYRSGSFEVNRYSGAYSIGRLYSGRGFRVVSCAGECRDWAKSLLARLARTGDRTSTSVYCSDFYKGDFTIGSRTHLEEALAIAERTGKLLRDYGLSSEVILVSRHVRVEHSVEEYGVEARENRWLHELYINAYTLYMGSLLSTGFALASTTPKSLNADIERIINRISERIKLQARARRFNPVHVGSWRVLLSGDAACAFFHEIAHLLEADEPVKLGLDTNLGGGLKVIEDPFYPGPLQRVFDDEVYPAWRRTLVDDGVVVDYLRSRLTSGNSRPGNGRGLFTRPKPMYYQLVVSPGDWGLDEVFEEVRRLIAIDSIVKAELYQGYIRIVPEYGVFYEKGSSTPIKGFEVLVPVSRLSSLLIGLTRSRSERYSYEKNMNIYEVAPAVVLEARISV